MTWTFLETKQACGLDLSKADLSILLKVLCHSKMKIRFIHQSDRIRWKCM